MERELPFRGYGALKLALGALQLHLFYIIFGETTSVSNDSIILVAVKGSWSSHGLYMSVNMPTVNLS